MKKNLLLLAVAIAFMADTYAGLNPKRQALYHCVNYDTKSKVTDALIYESKLGTRVFHEVEVFVEDINQAKEYSYFTKVNYRPKYDAKVEAFTTGNFRIRLDHISKGIDGNIWTFARIPEYGVHSFDWSCKDVEGL